MVTALKCYKKAVSKGSTITNSFSFEHWQGLKSFKQFKNCIVGKIIFVKVLVDMEFFHKKFALLIKLFLAQKMFRVKFFFPFHKFRVLV